MQKVLVTGGTGYLARWCIQLLLDRGYTVRTTVRDRAAEPGLRSLFAVAGDTERLRVVKADLLHDDGWQEAIDGCDYILHVASPFPPVQPKDPDELIVPARDGTLRVLGSAFEAGVQRVVVTSSSTAIRHATADGSAADAARAASRGRILDEGDWASLDDRRLTPYVRSKVIAEHAAWDYADATSNTQRLSVVNPGAIIGPLLGEQRSYSLQTIDRMLAGSMPAIPRLGFPFSDVRDLADLHIRAMTDPAGAGQRFLGTGPFLWLSEIGAMLRDELGAQAARVPTRQAPNMFVRLIARADPSLRSVIGELGQRSDYSAAKAETLLGWQHRPIRQSVLDCARSILADGAVLRARTVTAG
jgi:nucleoside-diphosphate-sugar epimerase